MKLVVINRDWKTKPVQIKNKTVYKLKSGKVIPTDTAMLREVSKI